MSFFDVVILTVGAGLVIGLWAFADVVFRPTALFRVARVRKFVWLPGLALPVLLMVLGGASFMAHDAVRGSAFLGWVGLVTGAVFSIPLGGWYLAVVRPWVAAQLRFAQG
jgi:hypothetical protein